MSKPSYKVGDRIIIASSFGGYGKLQAPNGSKGRVKDLFDFNISGRGTPITIFYKIEFDDPKIEERYLSFYQADALQLEKSVLDEIKEHLKKKEEK